MCTRALVLVAALATLAGLSHGQQFAVDAGPDPVPLGGRVKITYTNPTNLFAGVIGCPWRVLDAQGGVVFTASCIPIEVLLGPLGVRVFDWELVDDAGAPVPPGDYVIEAAVEFGAPTLIPITIGGTDASLFMLGGPQTGSGEFDYGGGRRLFLTAPDDAGRPFILLASLSTGAIASCAGVVPLGFDPLLQTSLSNNAALFVDGIGVLGPDGTTQTPRFPIPDKPGLVGLPLTLAFLVVDPAAPCVVRTISEPYEFVIEPMQVF